MPCRDKIDVRELIICSGKLYISNGLVRNLQPEDLETSSRSPSLCSPNRKLRQSVLDTTAAPKCAFIRLFCGREAQAHNVGRKIGYGSDVRQLLLGQNAAIRGREGDWGDLRVDSAVELN